MKYFGKIFLLFHKIVVLCLLLALITKVDGSKNKKESSLVISTMNSVSRLTADRTHYEKKLEELDYELSFNVAYIILPEIEQQLHTLEIDKEKLNDLHHTINSNITKMLAHTNVIRVGLVSYQTLLKSINYHLHFDPNSLDNDLAVMRAFVGDMERYYVSTLQGCGQAWRDIRQAISKVLDDKRGKKIFHIMSLLDDATITLAKGKDGLMEAKTIFDSSVSVTLYDLDLMVNHQIRFGDTIMRSSGVMHTIFVTFGFVLLIIPFLT